MAIFEAQLVKKVAVVIPGLTIFGTFVASALAMKIAPLLGLLPGNSNKEIMSAWAKFAALPQLQTVLTPLGLDAKKFMIAVAVAHLIVALLLVLPSGKWGTRLAGLWAMVAMAGAEFCTRKTDHVPAGFPKEFKWLGIMITSATHFLLFFCGVFLVFSKHKGGLVAMLNELLASIKKGAAKKVEERGRSGEQSPTKTSKRDSTPKPTKKGGDSSPVSPSAKSKGRAKGKP